MNQPEAPVVVRREQLVLLTRPYVAPRTLTETKLAEIWGAALCVDRVGVDDGYLELGGDSLTAAMIFSRIEATMRVRLPMVILDTAPTVAQLALKIDQLAAGGKSGGSAT
jgi:acyl carrier protein